MEHCVHQIEVYICVVPEQNFREAVSEICHGIRAELAHADTVSVSPRGHRDALCIEREADGSGTKPKEPPKISAAQVYTADV